MGDRIPENPHCMHMNSEPEATPRSLHMNSTGDAAPPSMHMRLGHGLANASSAPKYISCFDSTEGNLTKEEPKGKKLLSESDLFAVLDCPVEVSCHGKAPV